MISIPEEIWIQILMELSCKDIIDVYYISHYFNDLCNKCNLFNKRKMMNFHRESGHCELYDISKCIDNSIDDLELMLYKLCELNCDLIRGDLFYFDLTFDDQKVYIFNGYKMILINNINDHGFSYGILPREFLVINDKLPKLYWEHKTNFADSSGKIITVNHIIESFIYYFDHNIVKNQCLDNIKCDDEIYTNFVLNDELYRIEYYDDYYDGFENPKDVDTQIREFKEILLNSDYIKFSYDFDIENNILNLRFGDESNIQNNNSKTPNWLLQRMAKIYMEII